MSEEMWHVQIEPGDVKTVTLEQMDDMYRLELISSSTLVWQPGMPKALPLSVVAGIEDEESDVMEIEPELIEPAMSVPAYIPPTHAPAPVPAPAPVSAPAPVLRQQTITPPPAAASPVLATAPAAPPLPTADFYSPESLRPITMSEIPNMRGSSGGGAAGKVVMGVAIAAGLLITLHRNDLLRPMAASAGQTAAYESLEGALGAPGFGTTRSVAELSSMLNPPSATDESATSSTTTSTTTTTDSSSTDSSSDDSESTEAAPSTASDASKSNASHPVTKKASTSSVHRSTPPRRSTSKPPPGKKLKAYKGSEYDPMNAKL